MIRCFPVRRVPWDFCAPIQIMDFANDDGEDCEMRDDFLRAFCIQTREDSKFMTMVADDLRAGATDPKELADKLEAWAATLDSYNHEFRRIMNNPMLTAEYFDDGDDAA